MSPIRRGLVLVALLLLCSCDHHKNANQAQTEAGSAAVAQTDSEYTGQPAVTNSATAPAYPRATAVTLPSANSSATGPVSTTMTYSSSDSTSVTSNPVPSTPPAEASSVPPPSDTTSTPVPATPVASSVTPPAGADSTPSSVPENPPNQVAVANPAAALDDATQQQVVVLDTAYGKIVIELDDFAAPKTCQNFRKLVSQGFYNHTTFHRVIPRFIIQGGDPNSRSDDRDSYGKGDPGYTVPAEIKLSHDLGAVAMARLPDSVNPQRDSNGSQFYICVAPCPSLDGQYTVFGHVIKGMEVAHAIAGQPRDSRDNPLSRIPMQATLESKDQALEDGTVSNP